MSDSLLRLEAADGAAIVELDREALGTLAAGEAGESPWRFAEDPDWERFESLRLLAASFGDGSIAAAIAVRPSGSTGHDADRRSAVLVDPGSELSDAHEVLISTELDAEGRVRRVGLELWTSEEPPPRRLAADRAKTTSAVEDGVERETVLMDARLDGEAGTALFEVVRPAG